MPIEGEYYTVQEAAAVLGVQPVTVRSAIRHGTLVGEKKGPRLLVIARGEVERYQQAHSGGQGWEKRKASDYAPSTTAQWAKDDRARRKAAAGTRNDGTTARED